MQQVVFNVVLASSLNFLAAASFAFVYLPTATFNMSHAAVSSIGGYACYVACSRFGVPIPLAMLFGAVISGLVGALVEDALLRRFRARSGSTWVALVASIGLFVVMINCISLLFGDDIKLIGSSPVGSSQSAFGIFFTVPQVAIIASGAVVFLGVSVFVQNSAFGRKLVATAFSPDLANIVGVNTRQVRLTSVFVGSALGGLTVALAGWDTSLHPSIGFRLLIAGVVTMIVSGVGTLRSLLGGAFLLSVAQNAGAYFFDSKWTDALTFLILICFLTWKPLGLSGRRLKKVEV